MGKALGSLGGTGAAPMVAPRGGCEGHKEAFVVQFSSEVMWPQGGWASVGGWVRGWEEVASMGREEGREGGGDTCPGPAPGNPPNSLTRALLRPCQD